jgi:hypothetical protein
MTPFDVKRNRPRWVGWIPAAALVLIVAGGEHHLCRSLRRRAGRADARANQGGGDRAQLVIIHRRGTRLYREVARCAHRPVTIADGCGVPRPRGGRHNDHRPECRGQRQLRPVGVMHRRVRHPSCGTLKLTAGPASVGPCGVWCNWQHGRF